MRKFNKVISVEISIDAIAQKMLGVLPEEYAHRDIVAEAIIGGIIAGGIGNLGYLYNALHGYTNDIDFIVGQMVNSTHKEYTYVRNEADTAYERKYLPLENAKIVEIDLYSDRKLKLEYGWTSETGEQKVSLVWVNHKECTEIAFVESVH